MNELAWMILAICGATYCTAMAGYQMACNDCGRPMPPFRDVGWTVFLRMLPPWIFGLGTLVLFMWLG